MSHEIKERAGSINGVEGRFNNAHARTSQLWDSQTWVSEARAVSGYGVPAVLRVDIRFDDNCKNGHNDFAITGDVRTASGRGRDDGWLAGGCLHDDIAKVFPELEPLIKWHLSGSNGPMHYISNTVYHAQCGKLDWARKSAVWPEALDDDLTSPPEMLKAALATRLPALLDSFQRDMIAAGFAWSPESVA
jgi:hypothetical protein